MPKGKSQNPTGKNISNRAKEDTMSQIDQIRPVDDEVTFAPVAQPKAKLPPSAQARGVKFVTVMTRSGIFLEEVVPGSVRAAAEASAAASEPEFDEVPEDDDEDADDEVEVKDSAAAEPKAAKNQLRKADLVSQVAAEVSLPVGTVRKVMEAALAAMAEALAEDKELVLAPLGKVAVKARKEREKGPVLTLRLIPTPEKEPK